MLQRRSLQGLGLGQTPPHSGWNINNERGAGVTVFIAGTARVYSSVRSGPTAGKGSSRQAVIHSVSPSDGQTDALKANTQQKAGLGR